MNTSKVIKRGFYNYISPEDEEKEQPQKKDNTAIENNESNDIDAQEMANNIIAMGNASTSDISALFSLDSSTIEELNSHFPTTEEQLSLAQKESSVATGKYNDF